MTGTQEEPKALLYHHFCVHRGAVLCETLPFKRRDDGVLRVDGCRRHVPLTLLSFHSENTLRKAVHDLIALTFCASFPSIKHHVDDYY